MELLFDERLLSPDQLQQKPHASLLSFSDILPVLASPDSGQQLHWDVATHRLSDGVNDYGFHEALPLLIPSRLTPYYSTRLQVPYQPGQDAFLQYFLLASIKQMGEINASSHETAAQKHYARMVEFLENCHGTVLDVGCDNPELSASLFPQTATYVGLDPFCEVAHPFRVIGVGEYLPFLDASFDNVVFNTSLDHILDWRRALSEAKRVLTKQGSLYVATYVWTDRADLMTDSVHFHHFRQYEMMGALQELGFSAPVCKVYESPKGDKHRHGMYVKCRLGSE